MHGSKIEKWRELLRPCSSSVSSVLCVSKVLNGHFSDPVSSAFMSGRSSVLMRWLSACLPGRRCRQKFHLRGRIDLCSRAQTQSCPQAAEDLFPGDVACVPLPWRACALASYLCAKGGAGKRGADPQFYRLRACHLSEEGTRYRFSRGKTWHSSHRQGRPRPDARLSS